MGARPSRAMSFLALPVADQCPSFSPQPPVPAAGAGYCLEDFLAKWIQFAGESCGLRKKISASGLGFGHSGAIIGSSQA